MQKEDLIQGKVVVLKRGVLAKIKKVDPVIIQGAVSDIQYISLAPLEDNNSEQEVYKAYSNEVFPYTKITSGVGLIYSFDLEKALVIRQPIDILYQDNNFTIFQALDNLNEGFEFIVNSRLGNPIKTPRGFIVYGSTSDEFKIHLSIIKEVNELRKEKLYELERLDKTLNDLLNSIP